MDRRVGFDQSEGVGQEPPGVRRQHVVEDSLQHQGAGPAGVERLAERQQCCPVTPVGDGRSDRLGQVGEGANFLVRHNLAGLELPAAADGEFSRAGAVTMKETLVHGRMIAYSNNHGN